MSTRRIFLRDSAIVLAGVGAVPSWLARAATLADQKGSDRQRKVLVAVFMRGAADGLNIVVPFSEKRYHELRPTLRIAEPSRRGAASDSGRNNQFSNEAIDLDGRFALHGALQPLKPLWDKGQLAIVEATGSPDSSRSHFDAQDFMESGTTSKNLGDGWLNRALPPAADVASPLRAVALGNQVAHTLRGEREAIAIGDSQQFNLGNREATSILEAMYTSSTDPRWGRTGKNAFEVMKLMESINRDFNSEPGGGEYNLGGQLGRNLQQLARLIKANAGVEAAFAEIDGWDHHGNEGPQLFDRLRQFSSALSAFCQDMGDRMEDIVVVTMSEFGRTVEENGNAGTDHGHGSLMMVLGGPVKGGKVYGKWPGLEKEQLFEGRDLAVTTDYRDVLGELVRGHMGQQDLRPVFPGFTPGNQLGLLRA
jgi:uncharacterized protein (DUF1501 family)